MIIAVLNTKGGTGKTTTALNLAVARALNGRNVLAVDGDRQGSLMEALGNREEDQPLLAVAQYSDGQVLRQQVSRAKDIYDDIVIDAGGRDNSALRAALMLADRIVIPFQPRSLDVWALDDMAELLAEASAVKDIDAWALLTMADSRGNDNAAACAAIPEGIQLLPGTVGRRKAIADSAGQGRSLLEPGAARDPKGLNELKQMTEAVFSVLH